MELKVQLDDCEAEISGNGTEDVDLWFRGDLIVMPADYRRGKSKACITVNNGDLRALASLCLAAAEELERDMVEVAE